MLGIQAAIDALSRIGHTSPVPTTSFRGVPPLRTGARVALISPSGPLRRGDEPRAAAACAGLGWIAITGSHATGEAGYFAGTDEERAADLQRALDDESIDAIWCLRGGYGAVRLLDRLRWDSFRERPKALIGYSDITALHLAIAQECGVQSYHGPTARTELTTFSRDSLLRALHGMDPFGAAPDARVIRGGRATGRLAGGNLALLASMCGTRWAPRFDGALVVLEDVNEATYRVDRMLAQLRLAGAFEGVRGILFGHCTNCDEEADGGGRRALDDILIELSERLGVPTVAGIPVGHIADQWTVPLGAAAELDATGSVVSLRLEGAATGAAALSSGAFVPRA